MTAKSLLQKYTTEWKSLCQVSHFLLTALLLISCCCSFCGISHTWDLPLFKNLVGILWTYSTIHGRDDGYSFVWVTPEICFLVDVDIWCCVQMYLMVHPLRMQFFFSSWQYFFCRYWAVLLLFALIIFASRGSISGYCHNIITLR